MKVYVSQVLARIKVHYLANISIINYRTKIIKDTLEIATIHTIVAVFNIEHRVLQPQLKLAYN